MIPDRRVQKTREAIYAAFLKLLNAKGYDRMTVQDVIDLANVGRSTFYAHYASKEALLEQLCQELFHHLFHQQQEIGFEDYVKHILGHFRENKDSVASLLLAKEPYFLLKLSVELEHDVYPQLMATYVPQKVGLPEAFVKQFIISSFIETLTWWLHQRQPITEGELLAYYLQMIGCCQHK